MTELGTQGTAPSIARSDVVQRIAFTLGALAVVRALAFVPLPGLEAQFFLEGLQAPRTFDSALFWISRPVEHWSLLALGITPYVTALMLVMLASAGWKSGGALPSGRGAALRAYNQRARILAVLIAAVQAYFLAGGVSGFAQSLGRPVLWLTGPAFKLATVVSLVAATMLVMYIAEQINTRGVGQGTWVILASTIIWQFETLALVRASKWLFAAELLGLITLVLALVMLVVIFELTYRRVTPSEIVSPAHPKPQQLPTLRIPLNTAGYLAPYFAYLLLAFSLNVALVMNVPRADTLDLLWDALAPGKALHAILYSVLIAIAAFVLAALYYDSRVLMAPYRGGGPLTDHSGLSETRRIDRILFRLTVFSALYLVVVSVAPLMIDRRFFWPANTDGLLLLIVVSVALNVLRELGCLPRVAVFEKATEAVAR